MNITSPCSIGPSSRHLVFLYKSLQPVPTMAINRSNPKSDTFQLAQNEAGGGGGGDTQRPSIARRKASGAVQRKAQQQNLLFSFICLLACVFLFIIFFGKSLIIYFEKILYQFLCIL